MGAYAWFDTNNNGLLDTTEVNDANRAYFSDPDGNENPLTKNVDFSTNSYIVDFIGTGNSGAGAFQAVDLSGFTSDDSIMVNFGKAAGQGTYSAEVTVSGSVSLWGQFAPRAQRGAYSNSAKNFTGYTLSPANHEFSYTQRLDGSSLAVRSQKYDSYTGYSGALVKVGMSLKSQALFATFANISKSSNYTQGIPVIAGIKIDAPGQASNLANWTSGTTILSSQVSVVWPNVYNPGTSG